MWEQCQERLQHKQETRARVRAEWDQEARDLAVKPRPPKTMMHVTNER